MSVTLLAQRGYIGSNEYYITTMKANTLIKTVGFACEMENWDDMTVDERMQRELKVDRVVKEIVPYIVGDPDWFFGSLIVDIYSGWEEVKFQDIQEVCQTNMEAYKDTLSSGGFLTLPDNKSLIALDGQHRLCALSAAIRGKNGIPGCVTVSETLKNDLVPNPEIGNADITVIFIKHENDQKIRKIFNKVNRYAKQTSKGENIVTSEDDMIAIITRAMFSGSLNAPLKPIGKVDIVNWKSNTIPLRSKKLTTAAAIYTMTQILLERRNITPKTKKNDELLAEGEKYILDFWNISLERIDAFKDYMNNITLGNSVEQLRKNNLLLKPVTQMALVQAINIAMDHGYSYIDLVDKINKIDWRPENSIWTNILVTSSSKRKMITGSQALKEAGNLIAYMLVGHLYNEDEKKELLSIIRQAQDNEEVELPLIVGED